VPVNEASQKLKPRLRDRLGFWDMDNQQIKEALKQAPPEQFMDSTLQPAAIVDINNPKIPRAPYQEFPKTVYHHKTGHVLTVKDEDELKAQKKRGFKTEPSPNHDYSQIQHGRAALKAKDPDALPEPDEDFNEEEDEQA
jgi:hypothetical protein